MNEKLEGCMAFVAVAMILHAAFWVNARGQTRKTMASCATRPRERSIAAHSRCSGSRSSRCSARASRSPCSSRRSRSTRPRRSCGVLPAGVLLLLALVYAVRARRDAPSDDHAVPSLDGRAVVTAVVLLGQASTRSKRSGYSPRTRCRFLRIEFLGIYPDRLARSRRWRSPRCPLAWWGYGTRSGRAPPSKRRPIPRVIVTRCESARIQKEPLRSRRAVPSDPDPR